MSDDIQRMVRVVTSNHSSVVVGMVGLGVMCQDGWEVTFENFEHRCVINEPPVKRHTTIWFKFEEVRVVG